MTNRPMNIRSAADTIAETAANHLRIHTMIKNRDYSTAATLIFERMINLCNDYEQGERFGDPYDIALNILTNSHGPQARLEMRLRALHFIDCIPR